MNASFLHWHQSNLATLQSIDSTPRAVGADTYHEIRGIRRLLRITRKLDCGRFEAVLSPRSHQYPEFVNLIWTLNP